MTDDETEISILGNKVEFDMNHQNDVTDLVSFLNYDSLVQEVTPALLNCASVK
jgi:hypothetical protein